MRGYSTAGQRSAKTRRLASLKAELAAAEQSLAAGHPSLTVGGKRLWRNRNNLEAADMTEQQWRSRWDAERMFLTADGESGKTGGNETIRVDAAGRLRIKIPAALTDTLGTHLNIAAPVAFHHRSGPWAQRVADRVAVRYDIAFDPQRGAGTSMLRGQPSPQRWLSLTSCVAGRCSVSTSTPIISPRVCSTVPVTRGVRR